MIPAGKIVKPPWQKGRKELGAFLKDLTTQDPNISVRLVGGAVRESLLGRFSSSLDDLDFAVNVPPQDFVSICHALGVKVIPAGIKFGTVICQVDGVSYEFTSLRKDIKTDGRHPIVEYTDSWEEDAQRRDLTINALYADWDGTYYDPTGLAETDLWEHRLRFIGDPAQRIREDYLRILRFFRFFGLFESPNYDEASFQECIKLQSGIEKLSKERKWAETAKFFTARYPLQVFSVFATSGIFPRVCKLKCSTVNLEKALPWVLNFLDKDHFYGALAGVDTFSPSADYNMPKHLQVRLDKALNASVSIENLVLAEVYKWGKETYKDAYLRTQMRRLEFNAQNKQIVKDRLRAVDALDLPQLPISGDDLIEKGVSQGATLGELLKQVEAWWVSKEFVPDKEACLLYVNTLLRDKRGHL